MRRGAIIPIINDPARIVVLRSNATKDLSVRFLRAEL